MTELIKFKKEHLDKFFTQPSNAYLKDWVAAGHAENLEKLDSFSAVYKGEIILCGGLVEQWPGRAQAWTVFDESCARNFLVAFRTIKRFLDGCTIRRLEIAITDNEKYHRRARMLGFSLEAPRMEAFLSDGTACALYARVSK